MIPYKFALRRRVGANLRRWTVFSEGTWGTTLRKTLNVYLESGQVIQFYWKNDNTSSQFQGVVTYRLNNGNTTVKSVDANYTRNMLDEGTITTIPITDTITNIVIRNTTEYAVLATISYRVI